MNTKRRIDFTIEEKYDGKRVVEFLRNQAKASTRLITKLKHDDDGIMLNGVHARTVDLMKKVIFCQSPCLLIRKNRQMLLSPCLIP